MHRICRMPRLTNSYVMDRSRLNLKHWEHMRDKCGCLQNTKLSIQTVSGDFHLNLRVSLFKFQTNFSDEIFDTAFDVSVGISGYETRNKRFKPLTDYPVKNRTRHLKCTGNMCEDFTILHIAWLDFSRYQFNIQFYGLQNKRYDIKELKFYVSTWKLF